MTSLVNKSADWTPNYHKILIFFPTKSLKSLRAARIDELADSNKPAIKAFPILEYPPILSMLFSRINNLIKDGKVHGQGYCISIVLVM